MDIFSRGLGQRVESVAHLLLREADDVVVLDRDALRRAGSGDGGAHGGRRRPLCVEQVARDLVPALDVQCRELRFLLSP